MKASQYHNPGVAVDVAIFTVEDDLLKVLLIQRKNPPFKNTWALPGGFLTAKETTEQTAQRVLAQKAGVSEEYIEQLYTFDGLKRDPRGRVLSVSYFALMPREKIGLLGAAVENPELVPVRTVPKLAFDHNEIFQYALKRLQAKLEYTNVVYSLLPAKFTLTQLQKTYEAILDRRLDKRNFRKKFLSLDLLRSTGEYYKKSRQRPALLYQFKKKKPSELRKFF